MFTVYARYIKNVIPGRDIQDGEEVELFSIPNTGGEDLPFLSANVSNELGNAGSFEFSVHAKSIYADIWKHMRTLVRVVYDGDTIFYGRVLTIDRDMFRTRKIHCEGAYTFFNDSLFEGTKSGYTLTVHGYLERLINAHNDEMDNICPEKKIYLGEVPGNYSNSISDEQKIKNDTQKFANSKGYKEVKGWLDELVQDYGWHMRVRYNNDDGQLYLDWLKLYFNQTESNQTMTVSSNVVDLSDTVEVNNIFTHVVPIGKNGKYIGGSGSGSGGGSGRKHKIKVTTDPVVAGTAYAYMVQPAQKDEEDSEATFVYEAVKGTNIQLIASPFPLWMFDSWTVTTGTVTITNNAFLMPDEDVEIRCNFCVEVSDDGIDLGSDEPFYNVTVSVHPSNAGTASAHNSSGTAITKAKRTSIIHLRSTANSGFKFREWSPAFGVTAISSTTNSFRMPGNDVIIYAEFDGGVIPPTPTGHTITVYAEPRAGGAPTTSTPYAELGDIITLKQRANDDYHFDGWTVVSGGVIIMQPMGTFIMGNNDVVIRANYSNDA